jgi:hypothetical protein
MTRTSEPHTGIRLSHDLLLVSHRGPARLAPLLEEHSSLEGTQVVQEQHAVQVIDLVLDGTSCKVGGWNPNTLVVEARRFDHDPLRPVDIGKNVRYGETPFLAPDHSFAFDDLRIDEHDGVVFLGLHDGDPSSESNLIRREADAIVRVHRVEEITHELADVVIDGPDGIRAIPKEGRAQQLDRTDGHDR